MRVNVITQPSDCRGEIRASPAMAFFADFGAERYDGATAPAATNYRQEVLVCFNQDYTRRPGAAVFSRRSRDNRKRSQRRRSSMSSRSPDGDVLIWS